MHITRDAYDKAMAEIRALKAEKQQRAAPGMSDELFELVAAAQSGKQTERLNYEQIAAFCRERGWWNGTGNALRQAHARERKRRQNGDS